MFGPLCLDQGIKRQRRVRPMAEAEVAVTHGMRLGDAPGPSLRIGGIRDDLVGRDRLGWRRPVQHLRRVPSAEIPGENDAASEELDARICAGHDGLRSSGGALRVADNVHQAGKSRIGLGLLEVYELDLDRVDRRRQLGLGDAGQRDRYLDEEIEVYRVVRQRRLDRAGRGYRAGHGAHGSAQHLAACEVGHRLLRCLCYLGGSAKPQRGFWAARLGTAGPQVPDSHWAFSRMKVKSDGLVGTPSGVALPWQAMQLEESSGMRPWL